MRSCMLRFRRSEIWMSGRVRGGQSFMLHQINPCTVSHACECPCVFLNSECPSIHLVSSLSSRPNSLSSSTAISARIEAVTVKSHKWTVRSEASSLHTLCRCAVHAVTHASCPPCRAPFWRTLSTARATGLPCKLIARARARTSVGRQGSDASGYVVQRTCSAKLSHAIRRPVGAAPACTAMLHARVALSRTGPPRACRSIGAAWELATIR